MWSTGVSCKIAWRTQSLRMGTVCSEDSRATLCHSFSQPLHSSLNCRDILISLVSLYPLRCAHVHFSASLHATNKQIALLKKGFPGNGNPPRLRPCTHTHTHTHTCKHTHTRSHTHTCKHTHTRSHTHTCKHTHTRSHTHTTGVGRNSHGGVLLLRGAHKCARSAPTREVCWHVP